MRSADFIGIYRKKLSLLGDRQRFKSQSCERKIDSDKVQRSRPRDFQHDPSERRWEVLRSVQIVRGGNQQRGESVLGEITTRDGVDYRQLEDFARSFGVYGSATVFQLLHKPEGLDHEGKGFGITVDFI